MARMILILILTLQLSQMGGYECSLVTIQKSGTHLVMHLISQLTKLQPTRNPEHAKLPQFYMSVHFGDKELVDHVFSNPRVPIIVCVRDLRDVALSMVEWYPEKHRAPFVSREGVDRLLWLSLSKEDKITSLFLPEVWGISYLLRACHEVTSRLRQLSQPNVYVTSFEKLVGSKGGGSDTVQLQEVQNIASHLGISMTKSRAKNVAKALFGGTATFRNGQIGRWKDHFSPEQIELAKPYLQDLLITLGYSPYAHT